MDKPKLASRRLGRPLRAGVGSANYHTLLYVTFLRHKQNLVAWVRRANQAPSTSNPAGQHRKPARQNAVRLYQDTNVSSFKVHGTYCRKFRLSGGMVQPRSVSLDAVAESFQHARLVSLTTKPSTDPARARQQPERFDWTLKRSCSAAPGYQPDKRRRKRNSSPVAKSMTSRRLTSSRACRCGERSADDRPRPQIAGHKRQPEAL